MKIAIATTSVLVVFFSVAAQGQILKCIGKDGKIEFATACPSGTTQQNTGVSNKPVATPVAAKDGAKSGTPSLADRDAEFRKRQADQKDAAAKSEEKSAEAQDKQRACESAKANLQALKDRQRMHRTDPKTGERVFYEEADYARETPVTQRLMEQYCKA